ncbi:hypothetical protein [Actibacterium ureilyticum]|uniref:hypothetical protein n=1 Tax=Actibacterium ureilyticum TaxID=1590614 RepID=UPI001140D891|nr:hypothetical protein [Actibacterium ureilyticum]
MRRVLMGAVLTGLFCAVFAIVVQMLTSMLGLGQVAGVSFVSGFLGSLFAQTVLGQWRGQAR